MHCRWASLLCQAQTGMGLGVAQIETADLLEHHGVGGAHTGLLQVEDVAAPTQVRLLRQELRVEGEGAVGHAIQVEELMMDGKDLAKVGLPKNKSKNVNQFEFFYYICIIKSHLIIYIGLWVNVFYSLVSQLNTKH